MGANSSKNKRDSGSVAPQPCNPPKKATTLSANRPRSDLPQQSMSSKPNDIPIIAKREPSGIGWAVNADFNYQYTEGQHRRDLVSTLEDECSEITDFLYVGGAKVAGSLEILETNNITRIINLAPSVVPNHFENNPKFTYLSIDMIDGRQDDISWFLCEVIQFVEVGRFAKYNTLIHCEKGISRSCSMAIAYIMWASESTWKWAFDYVKSCRASCAPNTSFTCNLIELDDLLHGESRNSPIFFRCSSHLPRDKHTPVLKLVRNEDSRKVILPRSSFLHSDGVFVIRPASTGDSKTLFVWKGRNASPECLKVVCILAQQIMGVFCDANMIELVDDGAETVDFLEHLIIDGDKDIRDRFNFDDLFVCDADSVGLVKRRRSVGTSMNLQLRASFTATHTPMILEDAESADNTPVKKSKANRAVDVNDDDDLNTITGGDQIVVGGSVLPGFIAQEDIAHSHTHRDTPKPAAKKSIILKHTLSMDKGESSVSVERPVIRNLTSTNLTESVKALDRSSSNGDKSAGDATISELSKPKPKLYFCSNEEGVRQWQGCGVYDDDDLTESALLFLHCSGNHTHFLWVGNAFSFDDNDKDTGEIRGPEGTESATNDPERESESWRNKVLDYAMTKISGGDLGEDVNSLLQSSVLCKQGAESELFWDKFYEGS